MGKYSKKSNSRNWLLILLILLLIALLGVGIWIGVSLNRQPDDPNPNQSGVQLDPNQGGVQLDPNQGGYVDPNQGNNTPSQGVAIPGWGKIVIPPNTTEVTVDFYNPEQNEGLYYLTFELRLPDGNGGYEVLYKSGLIEAGNHIQKITLSRGLAEGTYDAVIFVQPYRMDGITPTNNAETRTQLIVK